MWWMSVSKELTPEDEDMIEHGRKIGLRVSKKNASSLSYILFVLVPTIENLLLVMTLWTGISSQAQLGDIYHIIQFLTFIVMMAIPMWRNFCLKSMNIICILIIIAEFLLNNFL